MMSDRMETWSINRDEDGGYSQSNGKAAEKIFTPVQVATIKRIMQDNSAKKTKHYVKVFDGELGYLNIDISTGKLTAGSVLETESIRSKFTDKAIEQLKQRNDIPLDWDKVKLEEEK